MNHFKTKGGYCMWNTRFSGKEVGTNHPDKWGKLYLRTKLLNKFYRLHRIIWILVNGKSPEYIDHIDGNGLNNAIANLRNVTKNENKKNTKLMSSNTSGICGVAFYERKGISKWYASITVNKTTKALGSFNKKEDAIKVRKDAEIKYGFHENHGKKRPY